MKKAVLLLALLLPAPAQAAVPCALPFTLTNNTIADANQVMANYLAITACLGNAAAAGANNDISSLLGLSTPLPPSEGGTSVFVGGTSTGSANAQAVTTTTPVNFSLTYGYRVLFFAGATNTGTMTLAVAGTAATAVQMRTASGLRVLQGGEVVIGTLVDALYDGVFYEISTPTTAQVPTGTVLDFAGVTVPSGFFLAQGQCVSQTTFINLFAVLGGTYSAVDGCGAGTFGLPDLRGRTVAGLDAGGSNRITVAGGNFDGTVLGNSGGVQNVALVAANIPSVAVGSGSVSSGSVSSGSVSATTPAVASANIGATNAVTAATVSSTGSNNITTTIAYGFNTNFAATGGATALTTLGSGPNNANSSATANTINVSGTASGQTVSCTGCVSGGSVTVSGQTVTGQTVTGQTVTGQTTTGGSTAVPLVQPTMVLNKIIKY